MHGRVSSPAPVRSRLQIVWLEALNYTILLVRRHLAALTDVLDSLRSRSSIGLLGDHACHEVVVTRTLRLLVRCLLAFSNLWEILLLLWDICAH